MFKNRINREQYETLPEDLLPGEFVVAPDSNPLIINEQCANPGNYVICDAAGMCSVSNIQLSYDREATLPEDSDAIERLGAEAEGNASEWQWEGLQETGVVDPGWEKDLERHPLEDTIKECLPYLQNVFNKPIRHLRIETETVITSKARRLAKGAPDYLASHPEDWDGRTVLGVKPKRVLAKVRHEELDIYENRLAARLIDYLSRFLATRIRRLQEIEGMLAAVGDFGSQLRGTHWLQSRVSTLWGDAVTSSHHLHKAQSIKDRLIRMRAQLLGLMDSELYDSIPRRARIAGQIRMTNILRNDANYRFVAQLWLSWFETAGQKPETETEFFFRMQKFHDRFSSVVIMYVARALAQLGFTDVKTDGNLVRPETTITVANTNTPSYSVSLYCESDRTINIRMGKDTVVRVAPIFFGLLDLLSDRTAQTYSKAISTRATTKAPCIVIYPGSLPSTRSYISEDLQSKLTFCSTKLQKKKNELTFLPVSPYDITSVERMARCLSWFIQGRQFQKYPVCVTENTQTYLMRHQEHGALAKKAFLTTENGTCIKSSSEVNLLLSKVDSNHISRKNEATHLEDTVKNLQKELLKRHHTPGLKGHLVATKEKLQAAREDVDKLLITNREIKEVLIYTRFLVTCRCCGTVNTSPHYSQFRPNNTFEVECSSCGCSWGLAICGECHERYPFIRVNKIEDYLPDTQQPGWQEFSIGQDMLATPHLLANGEVAFECPWCGHT